MSTITTATNKPESANKPASTAMVVFAFAIVYIVWGSTYFFIRQAVLHIPPMLVGCMRFLLAGGLMLIYCLIKGEEVFVWKNIRPAIISGLLMLVFGNGILIWAEQYLTSSLSAILLASGPIWFVLLDKRNWKVNLKSGMTIIGLLVGLGGVVLLFGEKWLKSSHEGPEALAGTGHAGSWQAIAMVILLLGSISWAAGSLYSKYNSTGKSNSVNAGWQMLAAGIAFLPLSWFSGEMSLFHWQEVPMSSWLSILYLVTMGSLAGYSAFVWLLQVRSATQVSTHAYVNPVVAVLLGVFFGGETMSVLQLCGLAVILVSVLLVNMTKYKASMLSPAVTREKEPVVIIKKTGREQTV
jgi:drug/metabolite transporter (DMT)-like permease